MTKKNVLTKNTNELIALLDDALAKYSAKHVDVVLDDYTEDGDYIGEPTFSIIYHSLSTSFPIHDTKFTASEVNLDHLIAEIDKRDVGYCFILE